MRVLIFSILIIFMSSGCNSDQKEIVQSVSKDTIKTITTDSIAEKKDSTIGKPYFDFDEVVHYKIDDHLIYEAQHGAKEEYAERLQRLLNSRRDGQMTDSVFYSDMESFKKNKKKIKPSYFKKLNSEIFVNKGPSEWYGMACIPIFRDILVFKKGGKVTGLAKICFQCEMYHFEGNNSNIEYFGLDGEFETLKKLLEENSKK